MKEITPEQLLEKIEKGEQLHIIDVREDEEVAQGMIPVAKHIKMGDIPERLGELDKATDYIIVCRSGNRSYHVCKFMEENGYQVTNMIGGMLEWTGKVEPKL